MTSPTPGKIARTSPSPSHLRDLSSKSVRDQIVAEARKDAISTLIRKLRVTGCPQQTGKEVPAIC